MIRRNKILEVYLTPEELATEFANMDAERQAKFFNQLAKEADEWDAPFVMQLQAITDCPKLSNDARHIMISIGDYGPHHARVDG